MAEYEFETFDRRAGRLNKAPELTIQSKGAMSVNAAAVQLLGHPEAVELLFDRTRNVMGLRSVGPDVAHAYPIRPVGKGATSVVSARAFFQFYGIELGQPVRREVRMEGGVLIVDLNDPGRVATSNRNRSKVTAADASPEASADENSLGGVLPEE